MQICLGDCSLTDVLLNSSIQPILKVNCQLVYKIFKQCPEEKYASPEMSGFGR